MKKFNVIVNGESFEVTVEEAGSAAPDNVRTMPVRPAAPPPAAPAAAPVAPPAAVPAAPAAAPAAPRPAAPQGAGTVTAPMPGNINAVKVKPGDPVKAGDVLLILEAMKMENEIPAPVDGTVKEVAVKQGQTVQNGELLVVIA
ncbi:biotin/lipoyl-containing protein [Desulfotomaculum copahuensis]|uniref:Acetyl-CoA carboxylase biotin carboxyl carrier protein subunit n=1 Tax=Desulfotomaculum copahuensis TaxID=1838280 RepID=A0A1B7LE98_9FIRM|nr:biotin/lipoyl-containing protein [Desulfotomaculum copahuensis]OAT81375.1 acetyl-CoA carboxylase biotin carboxyl carrier protein subunit [Desulfotomaculum copahuensis]